MYVEKKCASCGTKFKGPNHYNYCRSCYAGDKKFIESIFEEIDRNLAIPREKVVVDVKDCKESEALKQYESADPAENNKNESPEVMGSGAHSFVRKRYDINDVVAAYMKKSYLVHTK